MSKNLKLNHPHRVQGSVLMLTLLVMSIIFSAMYFMANLAVRHINISSATVSGEIAILTADAAVERGLWAHTRQVASVFGSQYEGDCDLPAVNVSSFSGFSTGIPDQTAEHCKSQLLPNPFVVMVPRDIASTPEPENYKEFYLVDLSDLSAGSGYTQLTFNWRQGVGHIRICDWEVSICDGSEPTVLTLQNFNQGFGGGVGTYTFNGLNPQNRYILALEAVSNGFSVEIVSVPKGLPADFVIIKGSGKDSSATRLLEANIAP